MNILFNSPGKCSIGENTNVSYVEIIRLGKRDSRSGQIPLNEIVFVTEGSCDLICDTYKSLRVVKDQALFLPIGCRYRVSSEEKCTIIVFRLDVFFKICGCFSIEDLYRSHSSPGEESNTGQLTVNGKLKRFLTEMTDYLNEGFYCKRFSEIKTTELFFILGGYYSQEELSSFFHAALNGDVIFSSFIYRNWDKVRTSKELAVMSGYCETSFSKKFKKVFGTSPYKWLNGKRSAMIYNDITQSNMTLRQIADRYGFGSLQQFNDYCRKNFGRPPGAIRGRTTSAAKNERLVAH